MFSLNLSALFVNHNHDARQLPLPPVHRYIRFPEQAVGLEIYYRHENGVVFPGIRRGTVLDCKWVERPGQVVGWYVRVRDGEFANHATTIYGSAFRGFVDPAVEVVS